MAGVVYLVKNTTFAAVKFERTNKIRGLKAAFLLLLFFTIWSGSNLFYHSHIVNSEVVTHSHPYSNAGHTHTGGEMQMIAALSLSLVLVATAFWSAAPDGRHTKSEISLKFDIATPFTGSLHSLRAPPAVC